MTQPPSAESLPGIAIIGMAGRFPGAPSLAVFWQNLVHGVESIDTFTREELAAAGVPSRTLDDPTYVRARSTLPDADRFDAGFFGYTPHEATHMDPQQRVFLETAWEALEDAGYDPARAGGATALFAGSRFDTYLLANLCRDREFIESLLRSDQVGAFQAFLGNDKDHLTTRVAYKLGLTGPAITVQTACSTSLVAVGMACQSLLTFQSDLALAGGVAITFPQQEGYLYREGGMLSRDGHCRAFDANAQGTVFGSGVGLVVLKRLAEAVADGDHVYAVIKGAALNNDGAGKVSYTAPSVHGQAAAILTAQTLAGISPDTIGYVEAHGTGTPLGDPIELAALTEAFRTGTPRRQFCAIGSVKTNVGHLDTASGIAGLIKTALVLHHRQIPPSLHFQQPNPAIDFAQSPFYVNTRLADWPEGPAPRRAAVSSFGVGGTNAHVVLEEAPARASIPAAGAPQLLVLSARSAAALDQAAGRLREFLAARPGADLAAIAYTLQTGRREFNHRRFVVAGDAAEAVDLLARPNPRRGAGAVPEQRQPPVVFMFPGQGVQALRMGAALREREPVFRVALDRCAALLEPELGCDLRGILYPSDGDEEAAWSRLGSTGFTQPALFAVEYALAQLWLAWGVRPAQVIGHSLGEYVAACIAGVFTLEDALRLVARRGALVQDQPPGAMLAVRISEPELRPLLPAGIDLAAVNAPEACVVSGPSEAIARCEARLRERGIATKRLATSHAFHSAMVEPAVERFRAEVARVPRHAPEIPCVSNVTGQWLSAAEALDPAYWAGHLRRPVRFAEGIATVLADPGAVLLEVGPGQTLTGLARQNVADGSRMIVPSLPPAADGEPIAMLHALGQLWLAGVTPDWSALHPAGARRRIPLPTYPFERQRYFIDPPPRTTSPEAAALPPPPVPADSRGPASTPDAPPATNMTPSSQPSSPSRRRTSIAAELQELLRELAGVEVTAENCRRNFLELGLDSLFLTQAQQSFRERFHVPLTYRQLVEDLSTIESLAAYIDAQLPPDAAPQPAPESPAGRSDQSDPSERSDEPDHPAIAAIERLIQQQLQTMSELMAQQLATLRAWAPATAAPAPQLSPPTPADADAPARAVPAPRVPPAPNTPYPLTDAQREIWLACQLGNEASCAYNQSFTLAFRGPLALPALRGALQDLLDRHEALRLTIAADGTLQEPLPRLELELPFQDLSTAATEDPSEGIRRIIGEESVTPFDLVRGPLVRMRLARLGREHHLLVFTAHHLAFDGWSSGVILEELGRSYSARAAAGRAELPPADSFGEFARAEIARRAAPDFATTERFWLEQFREPPPPLELPADLPRTRGFTNRSGELHTELDPGLCRQLKELAAAHGCTLFTALLGAFDILLRRLSGQSDVVIGVSTAGQAIFNQSRLVGHCVNMLPIRSVAEGSTPFTDHLRQLNRRLLDAREHGDFTYGRLVQQLRLERTPGRTPLLSAIFNLERRGEERLAFPGLHTELELNPHRYAHFDLFLNLRESASGITVDFEYNAGLFSAATIARWAGHFETLLRGITAAPDTPLARLPLLTAAERRQMLVEWNQTQREYPATALLHHAFEAQVAAGPDRVALLAGGGTLTYRQLNDAANAVAARLIATGAGPETRIGLCVTRSARMVAALLGILKAGAAYVPLDPAYPHERLAFVLADAGLHTLLTESALLPAFGASIARGVRVTCLDTEWPVPVGGQVSNPVPAATAANLAYVIYTSGSTGRPKGVAIEHRNAVAFVHWAAGTFSREELDGVLAATSICFDLSVFEIFVPLSRGGRVILVDNVLALAGLPASADVRLLNTVPSAAHELLRLDAIPASVRTVNLAGEPLPAELVDRLYARPAIERVNDLYGPTETTTYSTFARRTPGGPVTIGRPIANTQVYLMDQYGEPVPVGVPGELHLGGDGVARGYLNRPELTAERFIPDPFAPAPPAEPPGESARPLRLYRTGDLARYRPDGSLELLGRIDHQVKIRGYRIEPGEIEAALAAHPGVADCTVIPREDTPGDRRLVAYVVGAGPPSDALIAQLRQHLQQRLPAYLVPAAFVLLEALPRTPNGKLDRRALPAPESGGTAAAEAVAPRTAAEETMARIWREVLHTPQIGINDNFFTIGGHSLAAIQVIARAREVFQVELPVPRIFEQPTIAGLAAEVERLLDEEINQLSEEDARQLVAAT